MTKSRMTPAEATDRHGRRLALCMALGAVLFVANAVERIAGPRLEQVLDIGQVALVALIALLLAPVVVWKYGALRSLPPEDRRQYFATDSFMIDTMKRARALSWSLTFATLVILGIASRVFVDVPAKFYLDAALAVMFGAFAYTVLALND